MIKAVFCIYGLVISVPLMAALSLVLIQPGRRISGFRRALSGLAAAAFSISAAAACLLFRFGTQGLLSLPDRIRNGGILYQDIYYLALTGAVYTLISILWGYYLKRLLADEPPGLCRLQENLIALSAILAIAFLALGFVVSDRSKAGIRIRELHGDGSLKEANGSLTTLDYITLENTGTTAVDLEELYLSDKEDELQKLSLKGFALNAGQSFSMLLDDTSPFKVGDGETVYLSDQSGKILDFLLYAPNAHITLAEPVLSAESGFYPEEFELSLLPGEEEEGAVIRYTLDGSRPTEESAPYTEPIRVYDRKGEEAPCLSVKNVNYDLSGHGFELSETERAFVVRAAAFDGEGHRSGIVNGVYFVGPSSRRNEKILSLTADFDELFGPDGICVTGPAYDAWYTSGQEGSAPDVNFMQSGREWEIGGNVQYFDRGRYAGGQDVGIRVFGGTSRELSLKPFALYSRKMYSGSDSFGLDLFGTGRPVHSIALRDGMTDAILQKLAGGRDVASQAHTKVSVFLNGEFWYDTYACEKYNPAYFYEHKGIAENNIIIVKDGMLDTGEPGDEELYQDIYRYLAEHDLGEPENYEEFSRIIDVQSYIDYACANIYGCNLDQNENTNRQLYRARKPVGDGENDGRWRWALYDMDLLGGIVEEDTEIYGAEEAAAINPFTARLSDRAVSFEEQTLFRALMQNEMFRYQFYQTFLDMMETDFAPGRVQEALSEFGTSDGLEEFFEKRTEYMTQFLNEELGIGE